MKAILLALVAVAVLSVPASAQMRTVPGYVWADCAIKDTTLTYTSADTVTFDLGGYAFWISADIPGTATAGGTLWFCQDDVFMNGIGRRDGATFTSGPYEDQLCWPCQSGEGQPMLPGDSGNWYIPASQVRWGGGGNGTINIMALVWTGGQY